VVEWRIEYFRESSRLTGKSTDEEIVRWTNSHDVFNRLKKGVSDVVKDHGDLDEALREYPPPAGHEGRAEQACPLADNRCDNTCPDMASRTVETRTQSGMNRRGSLKVCHSIILPDLGAPL
jgi:hypothetical protein